MSDRSFEGEPVDLTYQHLSERSNGETVAGTSDDDTETAAERFNHAVYAKDADFVTLALKRTTADRMAGWIRDAAETYDIGGADASADAARAIADRIEAEVSADD